jgi:hypothetical protein
MVCVGADKRRVMRVGEGAEIDFSRGKMIVCCSESPKASKQPWRMKEKRVYLKMTSARRWVRCSGAVMSLFGSSKAPGMINLQTSHRDAVNTEWKKGISDYE